MAITPAMLKWQKEIFGVTDEDFKIMLDEYHISERMMKESVLLIKDWYSKQAHLPPLALEDRTLEKLLANCKFSVESVKDKIDSKYTAATFIPEFFAFRDPCSPELTKMFNLTDYAVIPKLSPENYRIEYLRIVGDEFDYEPVLYSSTSFMIGDMRLVLDINLGDIYVWDLSNLKLSQVVKITPSFIKKLTFISERCYGAHVKGIHLINLPSFAEFVMSTAKSLMKKKIADRVFIHKSLEDFRKAIPMDLIPKDLGGDYPKTCRELADKFRVAVQSPEWRDWYIETSKLKSDESKRAGKSDVMDDDLLGLKGTFRKLDID